MQRIVLDQSLCVRCGQCSLVCPNRIFQQHASNAYPHCIENAEEICIGCLHCVAACTGGALTVGNVGTNDCIEFDTTVTIRFEQVAQLVRKRRSIRRYADKPVDDRVIEQLLDVVRWAPTAKNGLPIKWVIVNNANKVHELAGKVMDWIKKQPGTEKMVEVWDKGNDPIFRWAPCVIGAYTEDKTSQWSEIDASIAVETLDLCAAALRLGACWAGIFVRAAQSDKSAINQWLGIKETETIHAALMLGHIGEENYRRVPLRPEAPKIWIQ